MHRSIRNFWLKFHLYLGLSASLPLLIVAVTGSILAFRPEIQAISSPRLYEVQAEGERLSAVDVAARIKEAYPGISIFHTTAFQDPDRAWIVYSSEGQLAVDPYRGDVRKVPEGGIIAVSERIHRNLTAGTIGRYIVGGSSAVLLLLLGSGLWLWWPMWRGTVRRWLKKGTALGWHNVTGLAAAPLLAVMAVTGITITFQLVPAVFWMTGSPALEQPVISDPRSASSSSITLTEAIDTARQQHPETVITAFKEPWDSTQAYKVTMGHTDDLNQHGWLEVYVHPHTGRIIRTDDTYRHSAGAVYKKTFWQLHTGEFFGLPGRIIWAVASLLLPLVALTGIVRWLKKRSGARKRRRSSPVDEKERMTVP